VTKARQTESPTTTAINQDVRKLFCLNCISMFYFNYIISAVLIFYRRQRWYCCSTKSGTKSQTWIK